MKKQTSINNLMSRQTNSIESQTERFNVQARESKRISVQRLKRMRIAPTSTNTALEIESRDVDGDAISLSNYGNSVLRTISALGRSPQIVKGMSTTADATANGASNEPIIGTGYGHLEKTYTKAELKEYHQLFKMFDTDSSGAIGNDELRDAMNSIGLKVNPADVNELIKEIDDNGNGEIDFEEFCQCMKKSQNRKQTNEEIVKQCFQVFDQDSNGLISENEFIYVAVEVGGFTTELARHVFNELDVSSSGHISIDQFSAIVDDYLFSDNNSRAT